MRGMFQLCQELKYLDLSNFNTSNVINLGLMFQECFDLEFLDLSNFNTINVKNMEWMFNKCYKLKEIKGINILNNTKNINKTGIFDDCSKLKNKPIEKFIHQKKIEKKQITIIFNSVDQSIQNFCVTCYNTDIFETLIEKIYIKNPDIRHKEIFFIGEGEKINERISLFENKIKDGSVILIWFEDNNELKY